VELWKRYWKVVRPFKREIYKVFVWVLVAQAMIMIDGYLFKLVFDLIGAAVGSNQAGKTPEVDFIYQTVGESIAYAAVVIVGLMLLIAVVSGWIEYRSNLKALALRLEISRLLPVQALRKFLDLSLGFHLSKQAGAMQTRTESGISSTNFAARATVTWIAPGVLKLPFALLMALIFDRWVFLVFLAFIPAAWFLTSRTIKDTAELRVQKRTLEEQQSGYFVETLSRVMSVIMFSQQERMTKRLARVRDQIRDVEWKEGVAYDRMHWQQRVVRSTAFVIVVAICLWELLEGKTSVGTVLLMMNLSGLVVSSVQSTVIQWSEVANWRNSIRR